ncbi:hypothetical protein [Bifidobacterium adolescentis]|uniref:hypothetical protein n=1 Tax=Bifidobacterium adolescentis TaxID=1680 RepID=UPI0022E21278|nr:hypothetical protein [Bifidobacterium adolescentis]
MGGPFQEKRAIGLSGTVGERFGDDGIAITARVIAEVLSNPLLLAVAAACRMDRPIVVAAAMMITMTMMSILRPLLRVTLFHAFLTTNMAVSLCVSIDMSD